MARRSCGFRNGAWRCPSLSATRCRRLAQCAMCDTVRPAEMTSLPRAAVAVSLHVNCVLRIARLRPLRRPLQGVPRLRGIAPLSWSLFATMSRSDPLPRQHLRLLSLSLGLPGEAVTCPRAWQGLPRSRIHPFPSCRRPITRQACRAGLRPVSAGSPTCKAV